MIYLPETKTRKAGWLMDKDKSTSKVYFTDFRCAPDEGPADKLKRLIKAAGIEKMTRKLQMVLDSY